MDGYSVSSSDTTDDGESNHALHIEYLCRNLDDGESISLSLLGNCTVCHHVALILRNMNLTLS